ncbi:MAG: FUSC family protein [Candidatus Nanopelagicales bacterium]
MLSFFVGITMVLPNPITLEQAEQGVTVTADYILVLAVLMVISTIWGILLGWLLLLKLPRAPLVPVQREVAMTYGATLALLGGAAAAVALTWFPNTAAGWTILTIYVVVIPRAPGDRVVRAMRIKAVHRVGGTLVGVLIEAAIAAVISQPVPIFVLGIICLVVAMELRFGGQPYWLFVIFLTPGVVFLTGYGMDANQFALMRLACTVIGAILALGALEFHRRYTIPWIVRSRERDPTNLLV